MGLKKDNLTVKEWNELAELDYLISRNLASKIQKKRRDYLFRKKSNK